MVQLIRATEIIDTDSLKCRLLVRGTGQWYRRRNVIVHVIAPYGGALEDSRPELRWRWTPNLINLVQVISTLC